MNTVALGHDFVRPAARKPHPRQRLAAARARAAVLPWNDVPIRTVSGSPTKSNNKPRIYIWGLIGLVLVAHLLLTWYASRHVSVSAPRHKTELAVELAPPLPPVPKKAEPPKLLEPARTVQRRPLTVPQIEQPAAVPSDVVADGPAEAVAPSTPVAPPAAAAPPPVTAPFGRAGYLNNPPPDYPPNAARNHWEGTVLLRVRVLSSGRVDSIEVQKSSGRRVLDEEAVRAVKQWVFAPSKRGDTPVDGWATVPIEFLL